jgi:Holliday junction resolvasome RuvABC endonuclease subunit
MGWALKSKTGITSGCWNLKGNRFEGAGMRIVRLHGYLDKLATNLPIDAVYFEEVRRHLGVDAAHLYGAITHKIMEWCELRRIPYQGVPVGTVKKYATGRGNADKAAMVAAARAKWPNADIANDNEADARWIAECAASFAEEN